MPSGCRSTGGGAFGPGPGWAAGAFGRCLQFAGGCKGGVPTRESPGGSAGEASTSASASGAAGCAARGSGIRGGRSEAGVAEVDLRPEALAAALGVAALAPELDTPWAGASSSLDLLRSRCLHVMLGIHVPLCIEPLRDSALCAATGVCGLGAEEPCRCACLDAMLVAGDGRRCGV